MSAARRQRRVDRAGTGAASSRGESVDRERRAARVSRLELAGALGLTVVIVGLHVYRALHAGPLWRDEVSALHAATRPSLSDVWSSLVYESFPLLTYVLIRLWAAWVWLGGSDTGLRVLGALIGLAALAALWASTRLLGRTAPVLALALFALNPYVVRWGDSLRGYGLGALLIVLAYGLVWRVVESPTPGRAAAAVLVAVLSVQTLYQNIFLLFAVCAGGALVCLRRRGWTSLAVVVGLGATAVVSLAPYAPVIRAGREIFVTAQASFRFADVLELVALSLSSGDAVLFAAWALGGVAAVVAGASVLARARPAHDGARLDRVVFDTAVLVVGAVAFVVFLKATNLPTRPWYCIGLVGVLALAIDGLSEAVATTSTRRLVRLVAALAIVLAAAPNTWREIQPRQTNVDVIASALQQSASPDDLIVVNPWYCGITFGHYYRGHTPWMSMPPFGQLDLHRYDLLKALMASERPLQPVLEAMTRTLGAGHRVWLVGDLVVPPPGQAPPALRPAPHGPGGWNSGDYLIGWTLQLGHFVRSHVAHGRQVSLPIDQPVSVSENPTLMVFEGWRP
jgi:hypothetical protein